MLYATKLRMNYGYRNSRYPEDINQIYIDGCGWYKKETLHNHLQLHPKSIAVGIPPFPRLIPAISSRGEKYVRSEPDKWQHNDLMDLPRE